MNIRDYICLKRKLYDFVIDFLENEGETTNNEYQNFHENIFKFIFDLQEDKNYTEMKSFLRLLNKIAKNHHRTPNFCEKIKSIIYSFSNDIKQALSNREIFDIFKDNKFLFRFLLKRKVIEIDQYIIKYIESKLSYELYFYPEIHKFLSPKKRSQLKSILHDQNSYNDKKFREKRKIGENDSYICTLIRNDYIDEFVSYVNRTNISLSSQIRPSIFETNRFLEKKEDTTLIEYSAFFGSIQIFNYLRFNDVKITPRIWLYAIHSQNAEIFHFLEENQVTSGNNFIDCFSESIRCHHNDIAEYIKNNLIDNSLISKSNDIIASIYSSHNYRYFHRFYNDEMLFFNICKYKHYKIVDSFIEKKKDMIEKTLLKKNWETSSYDDVNIVAVVYYKLMKSKTIKKEGLDMRYYAIPPSITLIENSWLGGYPSLRYVSIPSSVTTIGQNAFSGCRKLKRVKIPLSVTSIGKSAFFLCESLEQIKIPFSVTEIGNSAFRVCKSLTQIAIPSSVTSIGEESFSDCISLTQITIPLLETKISGRVFQRCESLTQIIIPSSVTSIKERAFAECTLLTQITIPSSVTSIEERAFSECSLLAQISFEIPSSLTSIEFFSFYGCTSLVNVTIPSSVTTINDSAFSECSSLTQFIIPSLIAEIKRCTFNYCSALTQITIPSSLKKSMKQFLKTVHH